MKVYRPFSIATILILFAISIFLYLGVYDLVFLQESTHLSIIIGLIFSVGAVIFLLTLRIICCEDYIQIDYFFSIVKITKQWQNISEVEVISQMPGKSVFLNLRNHHEKSIAIPILLFSPKMLDDLFLHLPINVKTYIAPQLINLFVKRYGMETVRKFKNVSLNIEENNEEQKNSLDLFKRTAIFYVVSLIILIIYEALIGHNVINLKSLPMVLLTSGFISLVYFIFLRFFEDWK